MIRQIPGFLAFLRRDLVGVAAMAERREGGPKIENRCGADTGAAAEAAMAAPRNERAPVGGTFFDIGFDFDQDQARQRLTDLNRKFLVEAQPEPNEWRLVRMLPNESVPSGQMERIKRRLPLPPGARSVIMDSGRSVRFVITGNPVGERILGFTLGEESAFDCWIRGDWVGEELFRNLNDALRKARPFVSRDLGPETQHNKDTRA